MAEAAEPLPEAFIVEMRTPETARGQLSKGPYIARLDPGWDRVFGERVSDPNGAVQRVEAAVGDIVEGRGCAWSAPLERWVAGPFLALVAEGGLVTISYELARWLDTYRACGYAAVGIYHVLDAERVERIDNGERVTSAAASQLPTSVGAIVVAPDGQCTVLPETGEPALTGVCPVERRRADGSSELVGCPGIDQAARRASLPFLAVWPRE